MQIKVSGKGISVGSSLKSFTTEGISKIVSKYLGGGIESSIVICKDSRFFSVEVILHASKGFLMKSNGKSDDPYKAVTLALEKLESRIKKHKHRIKDQNKRNKWADDGYLAKDYVIERKYQKGKDEEHLVIAEQEKYVLSLSVSEAVAKLDLGNLPVVMFRNADTGKVNVVYKRGDGNIGWVDYLS
ncbi:MAG: ribosome-associated translation inhibitor RaiA [Holosporales bacterium]|jgi:ribosomal subunit interface protein|nr:ribosome-associated translation inhibitor RaiA [Holosporales bacterium]